MAVCMIESCEKRAGTRKGMCDMHYQRFWLHGDPLIGGRPMATERFWQEVDKTDECWNWLGTRNAEGYGQFTADGERMRAHRYSYALTNGPIPTDLVLDHLCRNTSCVRPEHLELVTSKTNILRGVGPTAINAAKTECKRGHEFTAENTYVITRPNRISRVCRTCERERMRQRWAVSRR